MKNETMETLRCMGTLSGETTLPFSILTALLNGGQLLKERICSLRRNFFHIRLSPFSKPSLFREAKWQVTKVVSLVKNGGKK